MKRILVGWLALLAALATPPASAGDWKPVTNERGIEVSEREVPGRSLPIFRGIGIVEADPLEILAVIRDAPRHTEWMHDCVESRLLRTQGDVAFLYNRTDAPWPVWDRDVVLRSETLVIEPRVELEIRVASLADEQQGPVPGVVRMPRLEGHYRLLLVEPGRTRVEYQIDADPGGALPDWIARRATRDLPLETIAKLREQVARTRGSYAELIQRWGSERRK